MQPKTPGAPRPTLTLLLSKTGAFCAAFREAFRLE